LSPDYNAAAINLARLDLQEGRFDEAEQRLKSILARNDRNISAMMILADIASRRGQPDAALEWVQTAWDRNPGALRPGMVLAQHYLRQGENLKAIAVARELAEAHPKNPRPLQIMGTARLAMGEAASAVSSFQKAAELQPNAPNASLLLANAQAAAEDYDAAIESLEKSLSMQPDYLPAQAAKARLLQRTGRTEEALGLARRIQEQHPQSAQGYLLEGDIHWAGKDYANAEKVLAVGFARQPTAEIALKLFQLRRQQGDNDAARAVLSDWLAGNPNDLRVRQVLGQSYLAGGETAPAIEQYRLVVEAQPNNVVVLNNLAWALYEQNDPGALQYAERAYELAPEQFEVADTMGWLLVEAGEVERGLGLIRDAAAKAPHVPSIRYHLGAALAKSDRPAEARRELERLLRDHPDFPEAEQARALLAELQTR
jgi:putative PEP-CTERM system TPR-repeat lipoprotein